MKTRPWPVKLITLFFLLVPITEYLIILYAKHRWNIVMTPGLWLTALGLAAGSLITAVGVWKVNAWGFYVMIAFGIVIVFEDVRQIIKTPNHLNAWEFIDIFLVICAVVLLNMRRVKEPYFNPKIRWWEQATRHKVDLLASFTMGEMTTDAAILDISASGCFIKFPDKVAEGDLFTMRLVFDGLTIETPAKVVRVSTNPEGVGLKFYDTTFAMRRNLRRFIRRLGNNTKRAA